MSGDKSFRELGSEFHLQSTKNGENRYLSLCIGEKQYVLSGRTALAHIVDDIKAKQRFSCVALPAYCCGSMVAPFHNKGVQVMFYHNPDVLAKPVFEKADAILIMDYFGFLSPHTMQLAQLCKEMRKTLIVDATQTAFSLLPHYELADYLIVSHRKWTDSLSASVYCREGFAVPECQRSPERYVYMWRQAAKEKKNFLTIGTGEKQHFLNMYSKANHLLAEDYENMCAIQSEIDHFEYLDSGWLRKMRRENAKVLLNGLAGQQKLHEIKPIYSYLGPEDCPLFFPIVVDQDNRAALRQKLIGQQIYCPIHWPIDKELPHEEAEYHRTELSLICDQRYGPEDMYRQLGVLLDETEKGDQ